MSACANCQTEFPAPAQRRGGRAQIYCGRPCQTQAANQRRASTRAGRIIRPTDNGPTYPQATEPSGQPKTPEVITIPPSASRALSDSPSRLEILLEKAHSRGGVTSFEIATIAKLKGISAWTPVAKIIAR